MVIFISLKYLDGFQHDVDQLTATAVSATCAILEDYSV